MAQCSCNKIMIRRRMKRAVEGFKHSTRQILYRKIAIWLRVYPGWRMKSKPVVTTACLYARVSTKDGRQDTENQLIALRDYCAKQGWNVAAEYVDHETGGTAKRPEFQRMFCRWAQPEV